jgi:hypothetical protein
MTYDLFGEPIARYVPDMILQPCPTCGKAPHVILGRDLETPFPLLVVVCKEPTCREPYYIESLAYPGSSEAMDSITMTRIHLQVQWNHQIQKLRRR